MKLQNLGLILVLGSAFPASTLAQPPVSQSGEVAMNKTASADGDDVSRDKREQAYAKLLEGQRYLWSADRLRSQAGLSATFRLAKAAFQRAVELDPTLAEGYTALAEVAVREERGDLDEAISLSTIAAKIEPDNFGARRMLARLYTLKSGLGGSDIIDKPLAEKAIGEWKQVTRLDPRNAEAWAVLSLFYEKTGQDGENIDALKKWLAAATPIETQFYRKVAGSRQSLNPEAASLKLGPALLKAGRTKEAIITLSNILADDPDNADAVGLLQDALDESSGDAGAAALESLQQAVFANPNNAPLVSTLARVYERAGKMEEAAKLLKQTAEKLRGSDPATASQLQMMLGDTYVQSDRYDEAAAAYEAALNTRTLDSPAALNEEEREFAMLVFGKWIQSLKAKQGDPKPVIERARKLLGPKDLFADRELISFYRESGRRLDALNTVRAVRKRAPEDYGFIRLEATLLTELGKVDEGVALIKGLMQKRPVPALVAGGSDLGSESKMMVAAPAYDEFSNYLFISNLYTEAGRYKEAADAADQAYAVARGLERKQLAKLTLATAQQMAGQYDAAEVTLREILKVTPGNPIAMNNLGYFLLERDQRLTEALEFIQKAVDIDSTNPSYLDSLGWAYFKLGKYDEAEKNLRDAARNDPMSGTIQEHLGDLYLKQGKDDLAKGSFEKALNLVSDPVDQKRLKSKMGHKGR
ncbi:MAG TPA: tetratricopeptide repeat protein [Pyrinomonadaceae bacterium]|nr:tetratricopeptide repeat protein [Pyrinomonadaceae bacterium]